MNLPDIDIIEEKSNITPVKKGYLENLSEIEQDILNSLSIIQQAGGVLDDKIDPDLGEYVTKLLVQLNKNPGDNQVRSDLARLEGRHVTLALLRASFSAENPLAKKHLIKILKELAKNDRDPDARRIIQDASTFELKAVGSIAESVYLEIASPDELIELASNKAIDITNRLTACSKLINLAPPRIEAVSSFLDIVIESDPECGYSQTEPVLLNLSKLKYSAQKDRIIAEIIDPIFSILENSSYWNQPSQEKLVIRKQLLRIFGIFSDEALEYIESRHEFIDDKCRIYTLGACARENSQAIAQLVDVVKENKRPESRWAVEQLGNVIRSIPVTDLGELKKIHEDPMTEISVSESLKEFLIKLEGGDLDNQQMEEILGSVSDCIEWGEDWKKDTEIKNSVYRFQRSQDKSIPFLQSKLILGEENNEENQQTILTAKASLLIFEIFLPKKSIPAICDVFNQIDPKLKPEVLQFLFEKAHLDMNSKPAKQAIKLFKAISDSGDNLSETCSKYLADLSSTPTIR